MVIRFQTIYARRLTKRAAIYLRPLTDYNYPKEGEMFDKKNLLKFQIISLLFCFIFFWIIPVRANEQIEQEKNQVEQELEKLKADRDVYESQISDLEQKFLDADTQLRDLIAQQQKIQEDIAESNIKIAKLKDYIPKLLKQRKELVSELYILTDDKLFYLTYFISAEHFFNLMKGKDETQIVIEEKIRKVSLIDEVLDLIAQKEKLYQKKIADLNAQQQELTGRIALIYAELAKHQEELKNIDLRALDLQNYLLSLEKINSLNNRDFVSYNQAAGENFVFIGGGTEHGIGMSQYGAAGLARLGKNYQEILGHYYQNTRIGWRDTSSTNIRVGIVLGGSGGRIYVRGGSAHFGGMLINQDSFIDVDSSVGDALLTPDSAGTYFEVTYKLSGFNQYYGALQFKNIGGSLYTINILNLEQYLKGVVPAEMPRVWPLEALKAQAIAARSYAYRNINPAALFDVDDSTRFQVYLGKIYQAPETDRAVDETRGQFIFYGSEIIPAYYHSTSGGYTENNENVWGGSPRPYLRGVPSPWEENSPWWSWSTRVFSRAELSQILGSDERTNVGLIQKIEIINRGVSGRVIAIKLTGSNGQKIITGQTFRQIVNLKIGVSDPPIRSMLFGIKSP